MSECKTIKCILDRLNKKIEKDNKVFATLSNQEKRIRIAWDVLDQLNTNKLKVARGNFVALPSYKSNYTDFSLKKIQDSCQVCALGGLLLSTLKHEGSEFSEEEKDSLGNSATRSVDIINNRLSDIFTTDQLKAIEYVFEKGAGYYNDFRLEEIVPFTNMIATSSHEDRLRLIMENIIVNRGTFIPTLLPVYSDCRFTTPGFPYPKPKKVTKKL